jgi:Tol biopolymer transport system component
MNCEQVEERLSAYLDNMLVSEERRAMALHLQACSQCMMSFVELRKNDLLLSRLPRVSPSPLLHTRVFSSPEIQEVLAIMERQATHADVWPWSFPSNSLDTETPDRLPLVSLRPGPDVYVQPQAAKLAITKKLQPVSRTASDHRRGFVILRNAAIALIVLLTLTTASLTALALHRQSVTVGAAGAITPPASGPGTVSAGPLPAGTRFVFLRNQALWSTLVGAGNQQKEQRLTPANVEVAANWVVSPIQAGHTAGDLVAYIDLRTATVHIIRSDGQQDTVIAQALLPAGISPTLFWKTAAGETILDSLAWSNDAGTLAFVGGAAGDGQTALFLYTRETGKVQAVATGLAGSVSHLVWSQDSLRLAFEVAHTGVVSIFDYNQADGGVLNLTNLANSAGSSSATVLTLAWSPSASEPAVTWSLGSIGNVSSLWIHHVGDGATLYPQLLLSGNYVQAIYSQNGDAGVGSWLLVPEEVGQAGDIWQVDLLPGANLVALSQGKQVSFANWSPDGSFVFYLDGQMNGQGDGYVVNVTTGATRFLSHTVALNPTPVWSDQHDQLVYSTGTYIDLLNTQNAGSVTQLKIRGPALNFSWSPAMPNQLVIILGGSTSGIYLVDTDHNSSQALDPQGISGQIQWTQIP